MRVILEKQERRRLFLNGFASIFDITGSLFLRNGRNDNLSGFQKDYLAMRGDWINIGNDMRKAMNREKAINQGLYGQ